MEIKISVKSSGDPEISIGSHDRSSSNLTKLDKRKTRDGKERNKDHL